MVFGVCYYWWSDNACGILSLSGIMFSHTNWACVRVHPVSSLSAWQWEVLYKTREFFSAATPTTIVTVSQEYTMMHQPQNPSHSRSVGSHLAFTFYHHLILITNIIYFFHIHSHELSWVNNLLAVNIKWFPHFIYNRHPIPQETIGHLRSWTPEQKELCIILLLMLWSKWCSRDHKTEYLVSKW